MEPFVGPLINLAPKTMFIKGVTVAPTPVMAVVKKWRGGTGKRGESKKKSRAGLRPMTTARMQAQRGMGKKIEDFVADLFHTCQ